VVPCILRTRLSKFDGITDPLSIAGGVIAIIQIADKVISVCKGYITRFRDALRDLRTIMIEIGRVKAVLEVHESLTAGHDNADTPSLLARHPSFFGG
jgi:hypothetical protein